MTIIEDIEDHLSSNNNIGLFLSGGFDSTTLAYIVFKSINRLNLTSNVTIYTIPRHDDSVVHVDRICEWLCREFSNIKFTRVTNGNPEMHHSQQVLSGILEVRDSSADLIILGDTINPDDASLNDGPVRIVSKNPRIIQPFIKYDKRATVTLANSLGILDKISSISHTCTESKLLRCGICWQCRERKWAFEQLNLIDIGTM